MLRSLFFLELIRAYFGDNVGSVTVYHNKVSYMNFFGFQVRIKSILTLYCTLLVCNSIMTFKSTYITWRRKWQPTPVLLPGKFHGQRSLVGHGPWGRKESDTTEWLHSLTHITLKYFIAKKKLLTMIWQCMVSTILQIVKNKKQTKKKMPCQVQ